MRRALAILFLWMGVSFIGPAEASDPLRLRGAIDVLELHPYLTRAQETGAEFSIQNGGSENMALILARPEELGLLMAFLPQFWPEWESAAPLRLFSSDDREFAALPGDGGKVLFSVPAGRVQSFYVLGLDDKPVLYLWSPEGRAAYDGRRQTFHATILLLLGLIFSVGMTVAIYRRSRRAAYAVVMGGGLMVLLASLWMHDVLPDTPRFETWQANRLMIIQITFALSVLMSVLAHFNLVIKQIIHRNYWTRVIIVTDVWLLLAIGLWGWQVIDPGYAGLLSAELGHIAMAMTCTSVLLGAVFVPDRRALYREPKA